MQPGAKGEFHRSVNHSEKKFRVSKGSLTPRHSFCCWDYYHEVKYVERVIWMTLFKFKSCNGSQMWNAPEDLGLFSVTERLSGMRQANDWLWAVPQDGRATPNFPSERTKEKTLQSCWVSTWMTEKRDSNDNATIINNKPFYCTNSKLRLLQMR